MRVRKIVQKSWNERSEIHRVWQKVSPEIFGSFLSLKFKSAILRTWAYLVIPHACNSFIGI